MATWKELEAQGVKRCCAMFTTGKQCRRRAVDGSWCAKHKIRMDAVARFNEAVIEGMKGRKPKRLAKLNTSTEGK